MMRIFVTAAVLLLALSQVAASQPTLVVKLRINNTDNSVYVPGTGEMSSADLAGRTVFSNPEHYYIASYLGELLIALAGGSGLSLFAEGGSGYHIIGFEQEAGKPVLMAFTRGDWKNVDFRAGDMEAGEFMKYVSPSFSFGLGTYHPLKVVLRYAGIDLEGSINMSKGIYKLIIENRGHKDGRPVVNIRASGE